MFCVYNQQKSYIVISETFSGIINFYSVNKWIVKVLYRSYNNIWQLLRIKQTYILFDFDCDIYSFAIIKNNVLLYICMF